jgi:hypothetical protein
MPATLPTLTTVATLPSACRYGSPIWRKLAISDA